MQKISNCFETVQVYEYPANRLPEPNPLIIWVDIDEKGQIKLNRETYGFAYSPSFLKEKLSEIFAARLVNGVFKEQKNKVLRDIIVSSAHSVSFDDFMKVVKAIEDAGSDSVQIDTQRLSENNQKTLFPIVCTRQVNSK